MVAVSLFEIVSLMLVAAYAALISDPDAVLHSKNIALLRDHLPSGLLATDQRVLVALGLATILGLVARGLGKSTLDYSINLFTSGISSAVGSELLHGVSEMPYTWHVKQNSSELINLFLWRIRIGNMFVNKGLQIVSSSLQALFILGTMIFVQPVATFAVLLFLGGAGIIAFKVMQSRIDGNAELVKDITRTLLKQVSELIQGVKDIKIAGAGQRLARIDDDLDLFAKLQARQSLLVQLPSTALEFLGFFSIIATVTLMLLLTESSTAKLTGSVVLLALAAYRLQPIITNILSFSSSIRSSLPVIQAVIAMLRTLKAESGRPSRIAESVDAPFTRSIAFKNVGFTYEDDGREALSDLSFTIEKGMILGIVGPSGAGKSTLVDILIGLLRPSRGELLVDGVPLGPGSIKSWMRRIGYVSQAPFILDDTLAANIALVHTGDSIDRDRVLACCRMARITDFLGTLENGVDTVIGERGVRLSGGQVQRVAIARALYDSPELIILDEATSALDQRNENSIQKTIQDLRGKVTLVVIAHRLDSLENADRILWIENGRLRMIDETENVLQNYAAELKERECL